MWLDFAHKAGTTSEDLHQEKSRIKILAVETDKNLETNFWIFT